MQIPKSFQLFGHTIKVTFDNQLSNAHDCTGEAHFRFNEIRLQGQEGYVGRPESKVDQDFFHELVHFILYYGECEATKDLWKNEKVTDRISLMLHQALKTAVYD